MLLKKGIQQKALALELGISSAAVSNWEKGKSDPSGDRLKKLAEIFGVEENYILGYGRENPTYFIPESPQISGTSETQQIVEYLLDKIKESIPNEEVRLKTDEAKILARGIDKLPKEQREQALNVVKAMFIQYADFFEKGNNDETKL